MKTSRSFFSSRFFLACWIVFAVFVCVSLTKSLLKILSSESRVKTLQQQVLRLKGKNEDLQTRIDQSSQPFARERIIRDELGLQLPNEVVIQVPVAGSVSGVSEQAAEGKQTAPSIPIYRRWLALFFGK